MATLIELEMLWLFLLTGTASWGLTFFLSRCAFANKFLDIPNKRSSHTIPTSRLGGLAIVLSFFLSLLLWDVPRPLPPAGVWALLGAGIWISLVGLFDDYRPLPVYWRLSAHFAGAVWVLIWLNGLPPLSVLGTIFDFGWIGHLFAAVYLVWLLNLYNFMDGIDGLAGLEAITVCLGAVVLNSLPTTNIGYWTGPVLILATAVLGFLFWNFPKAKIFMGDSGSGFLGTFFGVISIQSAWNSPELFWTWVILLGAFIVDSTVTLIWRLLQREKVFEAHRSHAYQLASQKFSSHVPVTLIFGAINIFWLLPIAILVALKIWEGVLGIIFAYLPLVLITIHIKNGPKPALRQNI